MMSSCIVLIIASPSYIYDSFLALWREKIRLLQEKGAVKNTFRFFFVFSDPSLHVDVLCIDDCIYCKYVESLEPGIFLKTMAAIRYCETNFSYDYLLRTNLSSFWNFPCLDFQSITVGTIFMQLLNRNTLYVNPRWKDFFLIIDGVLPLDFMKDVFLFLDGAGFLLSLEMIRLLLLPFPYDKIILLPDDIAISVLLYYHILHSGRSVEISELFIEKKIICNNGIMIMRESDSSVGFVRNKQHLVHNRGMDLLNFKHQLDFFYKKIDV